MTKARATDGDVSLVQVIAEELAVIRGRPVPSLMEEARRVLEEAFEMIEGDDSVGATPRQLCARRMRAM